MQRLSEEQRKAMAEPLQTGVFGRVAPRQNLRSIIVKVVLDPIVRILTLGRWRAMPASIRRAPCRWDGGIR